MRTCVIYGWSYSKDNWTSLWQSSVSRLKTSQYRDFSLFVSISLSLKKLGLKKVSLSVSKIFGLKKKTQYRSRKFWSRKKVSVSVSKIFSLEKKSRYQSRKYLVSKKSLGIGLENFGLKKSLGIGLENFGLKKSLSNDLKKFVLENFGLQKLWTW